MTPKPKVVDIPVLMLLRSKEIIRNWDDWPFSLFPYKEADMGIIAGFAKTAGFFSGQWSCCSCGDIMQISESSGGCVLSSEGVCGSSPTGPCRVSPVVHEVPFRRGPRPPVPASLAEWPGRPDLLFNSCSVEGFPAMGFKVLWCCREAATLEPVSQPFSTLEMVHSILPFPTGFSLGGGRLFGSHKSEGSFLNFWNVCNMDYKLCNWVCGKITVRAFRHCGQEGSVSLKILSGSSLSQAMVLLNPYPWRPFRSPGS